MSSIDSAVLDYISEIKTNWTEWSVWRRGGYGNTCQICKGEIQDDQSPVVLLERDRSRGCYHASCLEQSIKENPDLRGTIRL